LSTTGGKGEEQGGPPQWEARREFRTRRQEPALTPDQGPWVVTDHWPPTDGLRTRSVVSRDQRDTVGTDMLPTWQVREPDFSDNILLPQENTSHQPTFRRLVDYPPPYTGATAMDPVVDTQHEHWEGQGETQRYEGGLGQDAGDADMQGEVQWESKQYDGTSGGSILAPAKGARAHPPFAADRDQYMGPYTFPLRIPPSSCARITLTHTTRTSALLSFRYVLPWTTCLLLKSLLLLRCRSPVQLRWTLTSSTTARRSPQGSHDHLCPGA